MEASSSADFPARSIELPPWKTVASHIAALITAILFISAGVWKITSPFQVSHMMEQMLVPYQLSIPFTLMLAVGETLAGVLVLVPRFRRWGAWLAVFLLLAFMGYIGFNYAKLTGLDCSCFPWLKRAIGPAFFWEDAAMLAAALVAGWWARPSNGLRNALVVLGVIAVFTGVSYGSAVTHLSGTKAPDTITVDGKPFSLQHGRILIFFFDPTCPHCEAAARAMSAYHWKPDVVRIAVPVTMAQWGASFLHDTHFDAHLTGDLEPLRATFKPPDGPYAVALEGGRELGPVAHFDAPEPAGTLRKFGFID